MIGDQTQRVKYEAGSQPALSRVEFLRGKKVVLRPVEERDYSDFQRWVNDPRMQRFIGPFTPRSLQKVRSFCEASDKASDEIMLSIETLDGVLVGNTHIFRVNWHHRRAETGTLIGPEHWNRGYGIDAKMTLLKYAFDNLNMYKMTSMTLEYNERSLKHLLRCGYQIEGRLRRHCFKEGKYWDDIALGVFREEWYPCYEAYMMTED